MQTVTATYRIVTPMFLGGANHEVDTIRPPSVKGALRFWWRALNWGRSRSVVGNDAEALKKLHEEESLLFGHATDNNQGGGQGTFILTIKNSSLKLNTISSPTVHSQFSTKPAARYLGYGLMVAFGKSDGSTKNGQLERGCINENQTFTVTLLFKKQIDDSVVQALKVMGLLGGLGSRVRRGIGSVAIESLKVNNEEKWEKTTQINYKQQIQALNTPSKLPANEPPFTAFYEKSRIDILSKDTDCYSVLNEIGEAMLKYRSWGRSEKNGSGNNTVLGSLSEQNFKDDHEWRYKRGKLYSNGHPERIFFGLPHDYGKDADLKVKAENHERRASPLFFHVHQFAANSFVGVSIYLPAKFLPDGEKIKARGKDVPINIDWSVVIDFIDGKDRQKPNKITNRFPCKEVIIP
ncbi:MAG: type III-B CRISPR module RAMP protein Cmr1 [Candidatus Desantisbacteria bacterium]